MHYHGAIQACFERDAAGKPKNSFVKATESWDFGKSLTDGHEPNEDLTEVHQEGRLMG